ncbi:MAG: poly-beta-1,6-N-acetyl-D-glucosamine biosynthesis protein PgaD [Pigmentiphaga sp.]|uniref:poly-beta-1,6-N-acetyl-D-glucosamine biosynthesis protein PgaD n=1 Tax=Pigmentiphaga sp. TaxID=1977564 RepID=UPI0029A1F58A|nr:poly-beta-1,6-N-acetyl-D-glucosamine biosynthesis protein PgaD [Pigmentiphaga sp.]MDX3904302.1 poly-beta-1,6-N-acetyl-D-glucosamine biosynthesis protein PgaD [Pigmentiphaga sp.]
MSLVPPPTKLDAPAAGEPRVAIDASTMVITTKRTRLRYLLDVVLTAIAWIVFLYLFARGMIAVVEGRMAGLDAPFWSGAFPTMRTLAVYAALAVINALILFAWAWYNWRRFRGLDRRSAPAPMKPERLATGFGVSAELLARMESARILVVHHTEDGLIAAVDTVPAAPQG